MIDDTGVFAHAEEWPLQDRGIGSITHQHCLVFVIYPTKCGHLVYLACSSSGSFLFFLSQKIGG